MSGVSLECVHRWEMVLNILVSVKAHEEFGLTSFQLLKKVIPKVMN